MGVDPPVSERDVFEIDIDLGGPVRNGLFRAARPALERVTGMRGVREVYRSIPPDARGVDVMRWALGHLGVEVQVSDRDLERIPREGPAIVVCNHPFGAIEGIALAAVLARRRDDFRILANFLLGRMPALRDLFLLVDPFDRPGSVRANLRGMRRAIEWVGQGRLLATFPAGEVASLDLRSGRVVDPPWSPIIGRLARQTGAPIVPLFFSGRNGALFQLAGLVHPVLRTALLPRQMINKRGLTIDVRIGTPIVRSRLASFDSDAARIAYLRDRTEILAERQAAPEGPSPVQPRVTPHGAAPLIDPVAPERLAVEVAALPPRALVATSRTRIGFRRSCARSDGYGKRRSARSGRAPAGRSTSTVSTRTTSTCSSGTGPRARSSARTASGAPTNSWRVSGRAGCTHRPCSNTARNCSRRWGPHSRWGGRSSGPSISVPSPVSCCSGRGSRHTSACTRGTPRCSVQSASVPSTAPHRNG